jgi:multicomponent Na+:H+ antiporter subunit D
MDSTHFPAVTIVLFLAAAALVPVTVKKTAYSVKKIILPVYIAALIMSGVTLADVQRNGGFTYDFGSWAQGLGIQFTADAFSALMAVMIILISFLVLIYSFRDIEHEIDPGERAGYYTLMLLVVFAMLGITYTNDLFNLYVFMEILSIASCGIISVKRKRENYLAAFRYLMLNTIGSLSVLMGIALLYMVTGYLNMTEVYLRIAEVWRTYPRNILIASGFIVTGLAIKAALFPLHIWLPDAHSSAPTPSSALLSGLVVKVYVFCAAKLLFKVIGRTIVISLGIPTFIMYFAALSMVMGSLFAIGQRDIKRILAYSSVAQIGYVFLGIGLATYQGMAASMFHIISHALMKTALFLSAGAVIYSKRIRNVSDFNGIGYRMPVTMTVFAVAALGMVGIPGVNGFMSKIYLALAVLNAGRPVYLLVILASSFLNAIYYLPILIAAFLKEQPGRKNVMEMDALPASMLVPMVLTAFACVVFGFYPLLLMDIIDRAVPTFFLFK